MKRTIALLFALADIADIASIQCFRVRCEVLVIVRWAEALAYLSVSGTARDFGAPVPTPAAIAARAWSTSVDGTGPADATALASRLRALGLALLQLLLCKPRPRAIGHCDAPAPVVRWNSAPAQTAFVNLLQPP